MHQSNRVMVTCFFHKNIIINSCMYRNIEAAHMNKKREI